CRRPFPLADLRDLHLIKTGAILAVDELHLGKQQHGDAGGKVGTTAGLAVKLAVPSLRAPGVGLPGGPG
ncbi:hypothetical protein LCGC14_2962580, partial [marine sediment metagenome]